MKLHVLTIPKVQMIVALSAIFVSVAATHFSWIIIFSYVCVLGAALLTDALLLRLRHVPAFPLWAAIVTGTIITLSTTPQMVGAGVIAAVLAVVSKHYLRVGQHHIFNPAALGIFVAHLLFGMHVSWWAVSFQQPLMNFLLFLLLFTPGYVSVIHLGRWRIVLPFLIVTWLAGALSNIPFQSILFANPALYFFALVMLPEPMTSPNNSRAQLLYGVGVALLAFVLTLPLVRPIAVLVPDAFLLALLVGNAIFRFTASP